MALCCSDRLTCLPRVLSRRRFFAEEADSLQGLQVLVDDLSGFGQLASTLLPELWEGMGSLPVMLYAVRPSGLESAALDPNALRRRRLGGALSYAWLTQQCSSYTLVAPPAEASALPLLAWRPGLLYHTSAICAAALDTATVPYRLTATEGSRGPIGALPCWVSCLAGVSWVFGTRPAVISGSAAGWRVVVT